MNVGDLLRFEIEGQSIYLPAHKRVVAMMSCGSSPYRELRPAT